jgi:hypothetical protein
MEEDEDDCQPVVTMLDSDQYQFSFRNSKQNSMVNPAALGLEAVESEHMPDMKASHLNASGDKVHREHNPYRPYPSYASSSFHDHTDWQN